jgi:Protein of unknown function (DUF2844)
MVAGRIACWTALLSLGFAPTAHAALGGNVTTVQADRINMKGALVRVTSTERFTVHEMQSAAGTTVREYVSPAGTVFGVAWEGPVTPDLQQLLGNYFDQYQRAAQTARATRRGRGPLVIRESGLVLQRSGHQRSFVGRAYDPRLLPSGVTEEAVQ